MSFYTDVSAAIKGYLDNVSGIGRVYATHRYARPPEDYIGLFTELIPNSNQKLVNTWLIHRNATAIDDVGHPLGQVRRTHTYAIEGYLALRDASGSEDTFQLLVDSILTVFTAHKQLGLPNTVEFVYAPQLATIDLTAFGPVVCHHCVITLRVTERVSVAYQP
jgi:hypothetical protein